jgi:hypothetical protein
MKYIIFVLLIIAILILGIGHSLINSFDVGWPNELKTILVNISYSYVVACIFYFIALIPDKKRNKILKKIVSNKIKTIIGNIDHLFKLVIKEINLSEITLDNIRNACSNIDPHKTLNIVKDVRIINNKDNTSEFVYWIWADYILLIRSRLSILCNEIAAFNFMIDPNIVEIITEIIDINNNDHKYLLTSIEKLRNTEMHFMIDDLEKYYECNIKLKRIVKRL